MLPLPADDFNATSSKDTLGIARGGPFKPLDRSCNMDEEEHIYGGKDVIYSTGGDFLSSISQAVCASRSWWVVA